VELLEPTASNLIRAATALKAGEVVAYPTETVYGLGVDPFQEAAIEKLFEAKGRERDQAILLIVADEEQLRSVVSAIPPSARPYMEAFWPGPLSLLLPKHPDLPEAIAPGKDKICVRCPGSAESRALCRAFGGALTSTSANRSGQPPVTSLENLRLPGVALGIDGGVLPPAAPSTILDPESGQVLRAGAISQAQIDNVHS